MTATIADNATGGILAHIPPPGPWTAHARCRTAPPELFFPERGDPLEPARAVCVHCPVRDACRAYAINAGPALKGVWGGLSERERHQARHAAGDETEVLA